MTTKLAEAGLSISNVFIVTILHGSRDLKGRESKPWNED